MAKQQPPIDGFTRVNAPDGTVLRFPSSMSQQEILGVMRKRYPPANQQATSTESTKNAPEIPAVEEPTEARPPFGQAPPEETGGAQTLGPMGLMGSALPSTSARGTTSSVSPEQKKAVLELGKGPISLKSPEAQAVIAPKPKEAAADGSTPIFVPGTEGFAADSPKFDADKRRIDAVNERIRTTEHGYKSPSIDRGVAEDPAVMREMYDLAPSADERKRLESLLQSYSQDFSPGVNQERRRIQDLLELGDAMNNVTTTLVIDDPRKELYHHSRVLQKQADKEAGGDVSKYMRRIENQVIAPGYLTAPEEKRQAEILDKISVYNQTASQLMTRGDTAGADVFKKEAAKLRTEYSQIVAKSQADTIREIRELGESMDPADQARATALSAKLDMFFESDPQKKAQVALKAAGIETADQKLFGKMSSIDIARLALHTKYMQLEKRLGTNAMQRLWNHTFDSDVEKLKEEIELLAPAVILNQTPIQNIDKGFFGVAAPSFADPFGGSGTSQKKSQMAQETLGSIGALDDVKSRAALRTSGEAYDPWSSEEMGSLSGSSAAYMVQLIPMTIATEGTFAVLGVGSRMASLINGLKASKSTRLVGRIMNTTYEAAKQGIAYEAGGRLYDNRDEMNFASGFVGGAVGKWSQGKADDLLKGFEKKIKMVFGNKSKDVADVVINYGKKMTVQGARAVGTGIGETAEEFGEALGGIIDKSDTADQIIDGIKEQFPDASSTLHFAMQSFIMGAMMGQGTTIGRGLWARSKKFYNGLSPQEKKKFDDTVQQMNTEVDEEAQKEVTKQGKEKAPEEPMKTTEQAVAAVAETPAATKASGSDTWMSDEQKQRLAELEALGGVAAKPSSGFVDAGVAAGVRQDALGDGAEAVASRELTSEEKAELESLKAIQSRQQEHDQVLESRKEKGVSLNPIEDIPVQIVTTFDRMEADLPVSVTALDAASDWLYSRYKDIVAMKSDPLRPMTTADIDNYTRQLADDITALENHKLKLREQAGEATTEVTPTPTADAVQVGTTAQVGAQPVGPEVTGQEGGAGVGPSVQGPTAPQAGGPQGQVAPAPEPAPVKPTVATAAAPVVIDGDTPMSYQDRVAEPLISKTNSVGKWNDNSNLVRYRIENAGDIIRELSKSADGVFDTQYVYEKVNGIEKYIKQWESGQLSPDDTIAGAARANPELWDALVAAYANQPVETPAQQKALDLVNAILANDLAAAKEAYAFFESGRGAIEVIQSANKPAQAAEPVTQPTTIEDGGQQQADIDAATAQVTPTAEGPVLVTEEGKAEVAEKLTKEQIRERFKGGLRGMSATTGRPQAEGETPVDAQAFMDAAKASGAFNAGGAKASDFIDKVFPPEIRKRYSMLYDLIAQSGVRIVMSNGLSARSGSFYAYTAGFVFIDPTALGLASSMEDVAEGVNHELIHALGASVDSRVMAKMHKDLEGVFEILSKNRDRASEGVKTILDYIESSSKEYSVTEYDEEGNIAREQRDFEEIITHAFTSREFAEFLKSIEWTGAGKEGPKTLWDKLKELVLEFMQGAGFSSSALERVTDIVNEYFTEEGFKSRFPTAERQFADAGVSMKDEAFDGIEDPKTPIGDTKTVMVDGKERTALNSNGKPIHPTVEGVRNFWRWFGDSKVVDAEGRPLVVYHGTPNGGFSVFDVAMAGKTHDSGWIGRGIYMTTDQRAAYGYANRKRGESPQIYELYAKLENPLLWGEKDYGAYGLVSFGKELPHGLGDVVYEKLAYRFDPKEKMSSAAEKTLVDQISRVIRAELIRRGHDGVITTYPDDGYEAMVLNPNQIKSATGNYGTFDPANPSIRRMAGPREGKVIKDVDEYRKYTDAGLAAIESLPERAFSQLSDSEVATRMADAAVAAMKKSDWFKGQDIKQQRAAIRELRNEIADRLGVKLAPKTEKQQQRAEDAAFKLGQKLGKKEEARRNKELIDDFAEWKAKQKAKTKAEKQALEEKYAEKFGKHRDEVKAIIKEQKKKLAEAKTNIKTAMAAANEAVSKAVAGISAARKAGEASARRKASLEQEQVAAAVVAIIKENRIKGNLSFRQASMLTSAAAKSANFANVKSIERFMDLLDKVIDDVAYANQVFNIRKKQKIAKGKTIAAEEARLKQFIKVNPKTIDESLLYDYEQALDDLNLKVPRLAKMDAIYSQVVIDKPKTDIDTGSIKDRLDKLIDSLENLDVEDVDSYKEAIRLVNSIRRKTNEALLSEAITQVEAEEILKDIPDTQEKFDKAFGSQIDAIKKGYIAQIGISAGKVDTTGMSPEVKNLVDSATSLTSEQLNDLSPFDLDLLADLLDVIASEGTVHVNMLASVVARAETAGQGQRIADQLQFAPSVKLTEGGWVLQKVRMASKRSVAFWESALGLSKVKAGAVYKFIFAEIQRASVDSDKLVNAASLEFMRLRDKYKLEPGILGGPDPMVKLGMIITYLQEYDLSNSQMAQNNPDKGYGSRDWFSKGEMDKYMGDAISTKKVKAMIDFWNAMPKDENGNVSPKAVHDSFIKGDSRFLTENELGFLNELLAWKESNITPMQKFANELRGKGLDTIKYHMPRIRINSKSKEIPANKFFDSGARRITIESMSGRERKDFSVGPVETDLTKLFINNVDSVSVDYFYTQSVMKINDVLASAEKLSPDKLKAEEYVKAIRQVAADALNHEFSHAKLNKYIRRILTVRSVGILFGPLRPLQELLTAIISIPFRTGSPAKVYFGKMKDAIAEYEQWFKKNEYVLDVMERSKSAMTNRDGFNKIYEFKRDGYEKKTKFEKLAFALTSWPERTQINISWMPVFEQEFRREAGVAFDQAAYKLDPEAYFKKHKQAFLAASATADNSYQKIVGPSTQFGARKKVGVLGVDVETNSNAGMMLSWMSNWPSRSWWQLKDATTGFVMAEREARLTGYAVGDVRTDAASQALGVANETLVYSFLTNLRLIYGKAMATTIGILAASVAGDDDDEELSRVWDEANKEAMAGFAPSNLIQGGANSVISLATSPTGAVGREIYGLTVNLLLAAAENKKLGMDKQDAKFLREYMEKYMFKYGAMDISTRYAGEDAVQKALYNTLPALSGAVSQVYAVADAYNIAIPSMMKKIENGEELTLNEKEVYALLSLTINSANLYGMLAGGVALPFGQDANRMMKDLQKKHPGGQGLLLDRIPFGSTVK